MIPQTHAGTRTPAWPPGGGRGLPETGLAALSRPTAIAAHGMWPISTYASISMARVDWRARRKKLARATRIRQAWGSGERPPNQARRAKYQANLDGLDGF